MPELLSRGGKRARMTHVINVEIKDNHEDAALGGRVILQIAKLIEKAKDLESEIEDILEQVQSRNEHVILYTSMFY
ncbi:RNA polymerase II subunit A C-terminal domain phosphatase [Spiromyces aspiralis]|uniref:RNA polymerase II subunit A C-terminal domain phosphatase n=1 Tax=Spiromyces aspiralis TaxID=68401 RepID=A0ACC1H8V0_9FUNG|nr:RNA polymerase II subunit A C-terminal domain phosphatase [Spiromyces aspiralis]